MNTYLKVNFNGITVNPNRLYVQITTETLSASYLDISYDEFNNEIYKFFEIPQLILFSDVIPTATRIKFTANGFEIRLKKVKSLFWPKLCLDPETGEPIKIPWIKHFVEDDMRLLKFILEFHVTTCPTWHESFPPSGSPAHTILFVMRLLP